MNDLLKMVVDRDASDLHLSVGRPPVIRIDGRLENLGAEPLTPEDTVRLMESIAPDRHREAIQEMGSSDFGYTFGNLARFRVSIFRTHGNVGVVCRLIPHRILAFKDLGLPVTHIRELMHRPRGLVLVVGPTGSGKTTTLASMIDYINRERDCHIITIEDPIEYWHPHKRSIVTHRELHVDTPSFARALRQALRQDPDVILVGEMRDLETMEAAISAAETGHLVLSTLHTKDAVGTIRRFVELFSSGEQNEIRASLADNLGYVLTQQLIPYELKANRVLAMEVLKNNFAISNLIREGKIHQLQGMIETGMKEGMITMDRHLQNLCHAGRITRDIAIYYAANRRALEEALEK